MLTIHDASALRMAHLVRAAESIRGPLEEFYAEPLLHEYLDMRFKHIKETHELVAAATTCNAWVREHHDTWYHEHVCPSCEYGWGHCADAIHQVELATGNVPSLNPGTQPERDIHGDAHRCPQCGTQQLEISGDDDYDYM